MVPKIMRIIILILAGVLSSAVTTCLAKDWTLYGTDKEGKHLYQKTVGVKQSPGIVSVWDELLYSAEGRTGYIEKRKRHKHPVDGFEDAAYRMVLYELNCFSSRKEYAIREVYEMDRKGKTLDYARAGSYRHWQDVPEGSIVDLLHSAVCPAKKTSN